MADITLKLIWYKLGETRSNMADRYGRFLEWYRTFDIRRVDIVDMFFVGWIVFACVVVGTLQLYLKIFAGKPKNSQDSRRQQRAGGSSPSSSGVASRPGIHYATESCQWLNSAINWIYLNYSTTPGFIQNWLAALNDEAKKSQSSLSVRFDRILAGSLPPRVTNVHTEVASKETFVIHGIIDSSELAFQVLVSQETPTKVELTNCDVNVKLLRGPLKSEVRLAQDEVHVFVKFEGAPEVVLVVKPHSVKGQQPINTQQVEDMIRRYITASVTHFQLSTQAIAGLPGMPSIVRESMTAMQNHVPTQKPDVLELFENQSFIEITPSKRDVPEKTPRHLKTQQILPAGQSRTLRVSDVFNRQDKRLLVKILKASGLGSKDFGCSEPYCMVEMDDPVQKHSTSVVKNTVNPFWDEHFLFDLNSHSKELIFEVFDREKPPGDDFLGMAVVSVDELCKNPSSRQIIPLAGRSPGTGKGGNITVEFLFMERADQTGIQPDERELMIGAADNLSPRRRIETNRSVMPGGLVVTTQTTTTERPQESPNRTDRVDLTSDFAKPLSSVDSSPHSSRRTVPSPTGGVPRPNDTLLTSSTSREIQQQPQTPTAPYNKSGESDKRKRASKKMTQSTPTEELKDDGRLSSTSSEQAAERQSNKPKRSSSIASTLRKRFSRQKKPRSQSADRASYHDDQHLRPPDQYGSRSTDRRSKVTPSPDSDFDISSCSSAAFSNQSYLTANTTTTTKDLDNVDIPGQTSNLQKSRSIGSSLKRLFKRRKSGRKNGPEQGSRSRDSSMSRSRDRLTADAHSNQDISQASSTANPSPDPRRSHQYQPQQQQQQSNSGRMSTSSAV
ncbi:uncharacterized protein LOC141907058 isoform X14 [Tubulanus polymorphus]|uniref:uncharacterized protein LOC141907058 isoform X14 n=1 Tax=Tubulanus polymorphus TaxID=672921 RepID=UPI003DA4CF05